MPDKFLDIKTKLCLLIAELFDLIESGEEECVKFYKQWVEEVRATVPKERLLVFSVKEGWGPLCQFLGLPQPQEPFPHLNDAATINREFSKIRVGSRIWLLLVPSVLMAVAAGSFVYYYS